jgi:predicted nucleotidyltransferase component of viral defense system
MSSMPYREQVSLLLRVLPIVGREAVFALKGGTAINLFVRDLPRLSVDIDLTFLPLMDRTDALTGIRDALQRIADGIKRQIRGATVNASPRIDAPKLVVSASGVVIKVEPNATLRGSVYPPGVRRTTPAVEAEFEQSISVSVVSEADLYGGKLVAALDRQHPRDLFDTKLLLDADGFTDEVRTAFVVYLASHSRPISEILDPGLKPLQKVFDGEFAGMTRLQVTCRELEGTRAQLINRVQSDLTRREREFLLSLKSAQPRWELMPVSHLAQMPAIRWKLKNVEQLASRTRDHEAAIVKLRKVLGL